MSLEVVRKADPPPPDHNFCSRCGRHMRLVEEPFKEHDRKTGQLVVVRIGRSWQCPEWESWHIKGMAYRWPYPDFCPHDSVFLGTEHLKEPA